MNILTCVGNKKLTDAQYRNNFITFMLLNNFPPNSHKSVYKELDIHKLNDAHKACACRFKNTLMPDVSNVLKTMYNS